MPRIKITDAAVARLRSDRTKWYSDQQFTAFQVAVGPSSKTYYATGRVNGASEVVRVKLGKHPYTTATAARRAAVAALAEMASGQDPRRSESASSPTLQTVLDDYVRYRSTRGRLSETTAGQYRSAMQHHCRRWLDKPITEITKLDIRSLHDRLVRTPYMANQLLRVLRSLFNHAIDRLDIDTRDPTRGIDAFPQFARTRIDDLAGWYGDVAAIESPIRRNFMFIAALTGIRRSNLASLQWADIDLARKELTLPKTKNGTSPTLPLSEETLRLLLELHGLDRRWVFPAYSKSGHLEEPRVDTVRGNIHQLRHMFTDAGAACSIPKYILKKLRGDITREDAIDGYVHSIRSHEAVNLIARYLKVQWLSGEEQQAI